MLLEKFIKFASHFSFHLNREYSIIILHETYMDFSSYLAKYLFIGEKALYSKTCVRKLSTHFVI
jgi:hypothetical protein